VTHAAGIDRLTGLLDPYGFLDRLAAMNARATSAWLMVKLDIMRFQDVNSGFGYDIGDALLLSAAARLRTLPATAVSRVGTNAFALAFELDDSGRAGRVVDDALELLKPRFVLPGASLAVQFAAGFAVGLPAENHCNSFGKPERRCSDRKRIPRTGRMPSRPPTSGTRNRIGWRASCRALCRTNSCSFLPAAVPPRLRPSGPGEGATFIASPRSDAGRRNAEQ